MSHRALPLPDSWPTREPFGGCGCSEGNPACSCAGDAPPMPAEAATEIGAEDQTESADGEVIRFLGALGLFVLDLMLAGHIVSLLWPEIQWSAR